MLHHADEGWGKYLVMGSMEATGSLRLDWAAAGMAGGFLAERQLVLQVSERGGKVGVAPGTQHCLHQAADWLLCVLQVCSQAVALIQGSMVFIATMRAFFGLQPQPPLSTIQYDSTVLSLSHVSTIKALQHAAVHDRKL